jgi:spore germination cell wall hydrolase CwlJ-like protein
MAFNTNVAEPAINIGNIDNLQEMSCLVQAVHGEAANQSFKGKVAVAYVILHRTQEPGFPSSICGVVNQKGQFKYDKNRRFNDKDPAVLAQVEDDIRATYAAMTGEVEDPTHGALYFVNHKIAKQSVWKRKYTHLGRIDDHVFFTRKT